MMKRVESEVLPNSFFGVARPHLLGNLLPSGSLHTSDLDDCEEELPLTVCGPSRRHDG